VVLRLIVTALAVYVLYAGLLFSLQRRVLYPGAGLSPWSPSGSRAGAETLSLPTSAGGVDAWYMPAAGERALAAGEGAPAAIVFHGNAEFAVDLLDWFAPLRERGIGALYVEYPGFAGSSGRPSEASVLEAARAGYDWLVRHPDVDPERVFAIGRSLGAGVAAGLSRERPLTALVLWSPFVSVGYMALRRYGLPPFLARDRYDTREAISAYPGPVLLFHGRRDPVIPYRHATILADVRGDAELITWECGHNDCPPTAAEFWEPFSDFLVQNRILRSEGS
jgi:fermentation-respiration switch protein FrsA (DUF1100 family)